MSVQQDRIKMLMATMYYSSSNDNEALNEGIRSISNFSGIDDLARSIAIEINYYKVRGLSVDAFLMERCGINLHNDDVGAITGADAGGVLKTADSVVPENSSVRYYPPSDRTTINGVGNLIVKWPSNIVQSLNRKIQSGVPMSQYTAEERIIYGLCSWWISESVKLVEESTGGNFSATGTTWTLSVNFVTGARYLGQTSASWRTTRSTKGETVYTDASIGLNLNMDYCKGILTDANGSMRGQGKTLDRTVAHEMTHAVLMTCLKSKHNKAPIWFHEGMAVLVEGGDDMWGRDMRMMAGNVSALLSGLHSGDNYLGNNYEYAAGYMTLRYLAHTGGSPAAGSTFMESSQVYYSDDLSTLIAAGNVNGEVWLDNQHGTVFIGSVNHIDASRCRGNNNILAGNSADNRIIAGSGTTSLWGGIGGNDILQGGSAPDMFWYGKGQGNDTVVNGASNDAVNLYDISLNDIASISVSPSKISLGFYDGGHLSVQYTDVLSPSFILGADHTAWKYNRNAQSWQLG